MQCQDGHKSRTVQPVQYLSSVGFKLEKLKYKEEEEKALAIKIQYQNSSASVSDI